MNRVAQILLTFLALLPVSPYNYGQDKAAPFWPARTADELVVTPSPEVGRLPEVRQAEVDLSSGTATLSYPLLEWNVGSFPMHIGLSYRVGSFTIEELPGWIGLGWNLTGGGSVSRTIVGLPDEYKKFELRREENVDVDYINDLTDYRTDASLDRYIYNCPGGTGQFVIINSQIVQMPESDNIIEFSGEVNEGVRDFRIITPDGVRYEFNEREHAEYHYLPECIYPNHRSPNYKAVSSWHLSRIITQNGADTISFEYVKMPRWSRDHNRPTESRTLREDTYERPSLSWLGSGLSNAAYSVNRTTFLDPRMPLRIVSRTASVEFSYEAPVSYTRFLSAICLKDASGSSERTVSLVSDNSTRRKLTGIGIIGGESDLIDKHEFIYFSDDHHHIGDMFNYPNAPSSVPYTYMSVINPETASLNPRRMPNFSYATDGALIQTVSSTGEITDYEYEPNTIILRRKPAVRKSLSSSMTGIDSIVKIQYPIIPIDTTVIDFPDNPSDPTPDTAVDDSTLTIGIRIKKISTRDVVSGRRSIREFTYGEGICNMDLLTLTRSDFIVVSGVKWFRSIGSFGTGPVYDTSSTLLCGSRMPGASPEQARIFYGKVTEKAGGTGIDRPLVTEYEFDTSRCRLTRIYGGKDYSGVSLGSDKRSLYPDFWPVGTTDAEYKLFNSRIVHGYFREHIGAVPELTRRTVFQWSNGVYHPIETEERFYSTTDSTCVTTGIHHEPLVRQIREYPSGNVVNDFRSTDDISYFNIRTEASSRQLDSIAVTRTFSDGSTRQRTVRNHYLYQMPISHRPIYPILKTIRDSAEFYPGPLLVPQSGVWNTDSIMPSSNKLRIQTGETIREGGHTLEHHIAVAGMVRSMFYNSVRNRGLRTLPVREMWIMDGCDTLHRQYNYGNFTGSGGAVMTLPISVTTSLSRSGGAADTVDVQRVHSYTPYGRPTLVSQTGKPLAAYTWGYGGDLIKSISIMENDFGRNDGKRSKAVTGPPLDWNGSVADCAETLRSDFEWRPLVGCSQIRLPSGKTSKFDYHGGRLHRVCDGLGRLLTQYDYVFYDASTERFAGCNRISATSFLLDSPQGSTSTKILDGFSLPVAEIAEESGASGEDVASVSRYDALGRPVARWMPLALEENAIVDAMKRDTPLKKAATEQFADSVAFSRIEYPDRPGTAECSATLGGSDFADHPQLSELTCSNPSDAARRVVRWIWDGETLSASGFYAAGELDAVMTEDGDGRRTWTFTDCLGRQVLSRSATEQPDRYADTYTVSDPWGNPLLVLPPEASDRLGRSGTLTLSSGAVTELLDGYAFIYSYDSRLRLRSKKLPGCEPVRYAYDTENRLIFSRDGNQALQGRRSFMLYDGYGRVCLTGTCRDALSEDFWSAGASDHPATSVNPIDLISSKNGLYVLNFPDTSGDYADARLLTATFFDDYSFLSAMGQNLQAEPRPSGAIARPRGLPTGSLTAVLGSDGASDSISPLLSVSYYDREERVIGTATLTHRGDLLSSSTTYTRGGLPTDVTSSLQPSGSTSKRTITTTNNYDRHGRILSTELSVGEAAPLTVASCGYDRHGRLQRTDYHGGLWRNSGYDMHGWPTGWHCGYLGQQLLYAGGTSPTYTGRVSTKITNSYGHYDSYAYRYDLLGRLTEASFSRRMPEGATAENGSPDADFSTTYSYDLQGNILSLTRHGLKAPGVYGEIDDITAGYSGNRLTTLCDAAATVLLESSLDLQEGSWSGSDFAYDANGNQTRDMSRGVAAVEYNELNLPRRVEFAGGGRIEYLYTATGTKLGERVYDGEGVEICRRDYAGAFEFEGDTLERMLVPEGFVTASDSTLHIFIPDYQGSL